VTPEFSEVGTINHLGAVGNDMEVEGSVGEREEEDKDAVDCSPRMNETTSTATKRFPFALIFHLWLGTYIAAVFFLFNFLKWRSSIRCFSQIWRLKYDTIKKSSMLL
jgi:hypothetical protein